MKTIFWEKETVACIEQATVRRSYVARAGVVLERWSVHVAIHTQAHYDTKHGVLVVDHTLEAGLLSLDSPPPLPTRTLETVLTEAAAIRRAVALADAWQAAIIAALPESTDVHSDAELIEQAKARGAVLESLPYDDY